MKSENNNSLAKNSVALGVRMVIRMVISLYTTRIILKSLGIEDYGIFNVIAGFTAMFSFVNSSMSASISRFLSFGLGKRHSNSDLTKTFQVCFTSQVVLACGVFILAEIIGVPVINKFLSLPVNKVPTANILYQCTIISMLVNILQVPFNATIIAFEKMTAYAYIEIIYVTALLGIAFMLQVLTGPLLVYYGLMLVLLNVVILGCYYLYTRHFKICIPALKFDWKSIKPIIIFSGSDFYYNFSMSVQSQGQNIIMNKYYGLVANASVGISNQVYGAFLMFSYSITTAVRPRIIKLYAAEQYDSFKALIFDSSRFIAFFNTLVCIPIYLSIHYILTLWLGELPEYAILFTKVVILNHYVFSCKTILIAGVQATGEIAKYSFLSGSLYIFSIGIQFLIAYLGLSAGIAYGLILVTTGFNMVLIVYYLSCLTKIHTSKLVNRLIVPPLFIMAVILVLEFLIKNTLSLNLTIEILYICFLTLLSIMLSYLFILDANTRNLLNKYIIHFIK